MASKALAAGLNQPDGAPSTLIPRTDWATLLLGLHALVRSGQEHTSPPSFSTPTRNMREPRKRQMHRCRCTMVRELWMGFTSRKVRIHSSRQMRERDSPTLVINSSLGS